jgi:hypothetical protein
MWTRTCGLLLAVALIPAAAKADDVGPSPDRPAPRFGGLVGYEVRFDKLDGSDAEAVALSLRVDAEGRPIAGDLFHGLAPLATLSGALLRDGLADRTIRWRGELRVIPGVRWTVGERSASPRNKAYLDVGVGAFWSNHTADPTLSVDRWRRPQVGAVARIGAGFVWDATSRSRWMLDVSCLPYLERLGGVNCGLSVGYGRALR